MRTEPDVDRAALLAVLRDRYGFDVAELSFVPFGTDSWSYVAVRQDGDRAFVKLSRVAQPGARPGSGIPLMAALADGLVPVPRPIADRDDGYLNVVDGFEVQVLEHLAGDSLENETAWPDDLYACVAELVAAVHASTSFVAHLVGRRERYELPFIPTLAGTLVAIADRSAAGDTETVATLRSMLAPRISAIRAAMGRLEELRSTAMTGDRLEVLCHTDIWGSNLIRSADGSLHLLDWNGALIGPPEHDLFMFGGTTFFPAERFGWFLDRYERSFGPVHPDPDILGFYFYRRNLEDLAGWVGSIADDRMEAIGPAATIRVVADLLAEMPLIEEKIRRVRASLAGRDRTRTEP